MVVQDKDVAKIVEEIKAARCKIQQEEDELEVLKRQAWFDLLHTPVVTACIELGLVARQPDSEMAHLENTDNIRYCAKSFGGCDTWVYACRYCYPYNKTTRHRFVREKTFPGTRKPNIIEPITQEDFVSACHDLLEKEHAKIGAKANG